MLKVLLHCFAISTVASEKKKSDVSDSHFFMCVIHGGFRGAMVGLFSVRQCSSPPFMSGLTELLLKPWCVHWPSACRFLVLHKKSGNFSVIPQVFFFFFFNQHNLSYNVGLPRLSLYFSSLFCPIYVLGYFFTFFPTVSVCVCVCVSVYYFGYHVLNF